ncbi:D-2-hydroxyacid dehydrogenase [Lacticaseibacillus sp. 866-1]|uniref:D-2-hydroxyacid dehydrogenase n=1 Tax=Lacticaseibacillus sp. 866-1 TaxID=2799576 RepID=UPI001943B27F|nr:D-2-hydroxyacid dehydrogenase [Lacticaseibacillus sp. 866-1]
MKIIVYGVKPDELAYFEAWQKTHNQPLSLHSELLDEKTVAWARGFDGVNCLQTTPYSAAVFTQLAEFGIHFLTIRNVGLDNLDLAAAKQNKIRIANVPAYSPSAIAEFAVTMTLYLLRRLGETRAPLAAGNWNQAASFLGRELGQSTVGVVGAGRIGQAAIRLFAGFGANVLAYDPHPGHPEPRATYVSLKQLLAESDVVDLQVPGIPANDHLIDDAALTLMKQNAVLINTARGNLVDTTALLKHLRAGHLGGAGIDTYEHESPALLRYEQTGKFTDPQWEELAQLPNVLLTPHVAYHTETAVENMVNFSLANLVGFLTTGEAPDEVRIK